MVEAGRVDHAHHEGNAYRALHEAVELSKTVAKIIETVDLSETLVLVTADHSHVFTLAGYPDRGNPILGVVRDQAGKEVLAKDGKPYTSLGYWAGPGHEEGERSEVDDKITQSSDYLQQAAVPLKKETHGGEDVALFAVGPWAHLVGGMIEQNVIYHYMVHAMGLKE
jgi:alkaline phosphatase